ncbi:hypothetical protein OXX59_006067, partial [Metschnikowia pulcherrima]
MSTFLADSEAPIISLSAKKHFEQLPSEKAKLYAHHLSRAAHWGTRAVLRSVSPESEAIYDLVLGLHSAFGSPQTTEAYFEKIRENGGKDVDTKSVTLYLEYASQFLSNLGNYKSFGDKKFVPQLSSADFKKIVDSARNAKLTALFESVENQLYSTEPALLGWPEKGQLSSYYPDCTSVITQPE